MSGNKRADQMYRRQFVKLSGVAGAGGLLALAGADGGMADGGQTPEPSPPGPGGANCPTPSALCGFPSQSGGRYELWDKVQVCLGTRTAPATNCLRTTSDYVVLNGMPQNSHNFLLLPTCRVSGIECPFIATTAAPNYWLDAWINAQPGQPSHVVYPNIGLGVNSANTRDQDQLHIHLAGIHSGIQTQLNAYDSSITNNPANWRSQIVPIWGLTSTGMPAPRSYRVLHVSNLNTNLFMLLRDSVVGPTGANMADQALAVTPRLVGNGGFYLLNSEPALQTPPGQPGGTGTVDFLLAYT
ncbi:CDP-diacylglycerol diphosphatase [Micromonospora lupini]|uniref:CDP-diacylglycerol diphosphatase n=1 Tax=Micromonospora lupini str. Lupac 08 TaxID=1150864 RepID=I0LEW4_9ACTN|nr:CDP-diacylglycerol diphosphatase [Micromonospora lupini]CCH22361.1 Putative CDP-diacylglycerol phosphotidylhydrolase [Micromonospora lupini str. Lupac 08]